MVRLLLAVLGLFALLMSAGPVFAVQPDEVMSDPKLEARARDISSELRCLVCQNQSIDDSGAPLARDLRLLVRDRLRVGDTDAQVKAYIVTRYGDFVLLKPPMKPATLLLWLTPPGILLAGGVAILMARRNRGASTPPAPLDPAEQAKVDALMKTG